VRAVVVGAGTGGLATAIALEQAGVEPIVIERAPQLEEAGFGLVVSANAVTALRSLGLRDGVAARGTRVRRAEIRNPRGELLTLIDYEALGWETYGILRAELQQAMLEVAPAERLRLGTTCIGATEDGQVVLDGADPIVADVVVGADGIRSAVRRSLFGEEPLRSAGIALGERGLASTVIGSGRRPPSNVERSTGFRRSLDTRRVSWPNSYHCPTVRVVALVNARGASLHT
jgi:2-polyprenyl-6-methoxyphenol hydroxylase-like FAD-dependent oxidoreductase